jgi:hypothetical protein
LAQPVAVIEASTNRNHPNPAARCRGNLRPSGRRGCQAVLFGHAIGTEDTGRFGRLFFLALITTLVWAFVEDPSAFFSADDVDADEWPGEDDDEW